MSFVDIGKPREGVTLITLNRPERMNAMAFDVMIPFREVLEAVSDDNTTRVVVVTGAGDAFCAGADLEDPGLVPNIDNLTVTTIAFRAMELLDDVIVAVRKMHQPVIAAVNGPAIGGGFCLSLACDIRIASDKAFFRAAGINNGLTASELGISYLLPRAIGSSRAFDIMLTGRDVDAAEAERIGLVSRTVDGSVLLDTSYEVAERIIGFSRWASRSPSACSGRASRRAPCRRTWNTRAPPSSTCGSPRRTSRKRSAPARRSARRSSATRARRTCHTIV
jgi:enoyl-CoA hydratase